MDDYYGKPGDLAPPIYKKLEEEGRFSTLLKLIDLAGYKDVLNASGYWTMFAPNDSAFNAYFIKNGIAGIDQVSSETASKIVKYALVYNAFRTDHIADYQSSTGWIPNQAFKRRTAYYDGFYKETVNGKEMVLVASNRNNKVVTTGIPYYISGDNNNKYISYFHSKYLTSRMLTAEDYNYFYPDQLYTGFNVLGAHVKKADIIAENGVIHEVSSVSLPLPSIDQYISSKPEFSLFKSILDKYLVSYVKNDAATKAYQIATGQSDDVYVKVYNPSLSFSPNNESFLKVTDNDAQSDGFTMFVPTNTALQHFIDNVVLKHYKSLDELPQSILVDLINAHMWQTTTWPTKFSSTLNVFGEEARFDKTANVVEKQVLSNGLFYATNKVQEANVFFTVYSKPYLNPNYTLMTRALNQQYKQLVSNPRSKFTLFMTPDNKLRELGYDYDVLRSEWRYVNPSTGIITTGATASLRVQRFLYNAIVLTRNDELSNLAGSGFIRTGDLDVPGEYIKWNNNTVVAAGNEDLGNVANVVGSADIANNGRVYYLDNILQFSERPIGYKLEALAAISDSPYKSFFNYLKNSTLWDPLARTIKGVSLGTNYTVLVPNEAAIQNAIAANKLPSSNNPSSQADKDQVANFIKYHILSKQTVAPDGNQDVTSSETLYMDIDDEVVTVAISNQKNNLVFTDRNFRISKVINASSIQLADRTLIHLIDNYLQH